MTRFKKELIKRGATLEETLPFLPYEHIETIIVHSDECIVSRYDNRIGWIRYHVNRQFLVDKEMCEDDESWYHLPQGQEREVRDY